MNSDKAVNPELAAIKLMCSQFLLDASTTLPVYGFDESQQAVYAPANDARIFTGLNKDQVNMDWLLHTLDFFRAYMTNEDMGRLCGKLAELPIYEKPSAWRGRLEGGCYPLSKHWKGTFAYLEFDELKRFRRKDSKKKDIVFMDRSVDEGMIQVSLP